MSVSIEFNPHDIWVGIYWRVRFGRYDTFLRKDVYICLIPCFPIHIWNAPTVSALGNPYTKVHYRRIKQ